MTKRETRRRKVRTNSNQALSLLQRPRQKTGKFRQRNRLKCLRSLSPKRAIRAQASGIRSLAWDTARAAPLSTRARATSSGTTKGGDTTFILEIRQLTSNEEQSLTWRGTWSGTAPTMRSFSDALSNTSTTPSRSSCEKRTRQWRAMASLSCHRREHHYIHQEDSKEPQKTIKVVMQKNSRAAGSFPTIMLILQT